MECNEARQLLTDYIDGELDAFDTERFEKHLLRCRRCKRELYALKDLLGDLASLEPVSAPAGFLDRFHENMELPDL